MWQPFKANIESSYGLSHNPMNVAVVKENAFLDLISTDTVHKPQLADLIIMLSAWYLSTGLWRWFCFTLFFSDPTTNTALVNLSSSCINYHTTFFGMFWFSRQDNYFHAYDECFIHALYLSTVNWSAVNYITLYSTNHIQQNIEKHNWKLLIMVYKTNCGARFSFFCWNCSIYGFFENFHP